MSFRRRPESRSAAWSFTSVWTLSSRLDSSLRWNDNLEWPFRKVWAFVPTVSEDDQEFIGSELTRKLRRLGVSRDERGARHEVWRHTETGKRTIIPRHPTKEIPPGTLSKILKDLGISLGELREV